MRVKATRRVHGILPLNNAMGVKMADTASVAAQSVAPSDANSMGVALSAPASSPSSSSSGGEEEPHEWAESSDGRVADRNYLGFSTAGDTAGISRAGRLAQSGGDEESDFRRGAATVGQPVPLSRVGGVRGSNASLPSMPSVPFSRASNFSVGSSIDIASTFTGATGASSARRRQRRVRGSSSQILLGGNGSTAGGFSLAGSSIVSSDPKEDDEDSQGPHPDPAIRMPRRNSVGSFVPCDGPPTVEEAFSRGAGAAFLSRRGGGAGVLRNSMSTMDVATMSRAMVQEDETLTLDIKARTPVAKWEGGWGWEEGRGGN